MKILMVSHSFPPEAFAGVEIHVYNLARLLAERHEVHVLHRVGDQEAEEYSLTRGEYGGVKTLRLVHNFSRPDPHELNVVPGVRSAFSRALDLVRPDVVHFHHLFALSADLVDEVKKRGIPSVASLHDYWYLCSRIQLYVPGKGRCRGPAIFRCSNCFGTEDELVRSMSRFAFLGDRAARLWLKWCSHMNWPEAFSLYDRCFSRMRDVLSKYDLILANSNYLKERYIKFGAPAKRMTVMHPGLDPAHFKACRHPPSAEVRFGYVGSIIEHKGLHLLVDAFRRIPEATLKIWGDAGLNPEVQAYRDSLNPSDNVRFMGKFSSREIGRVFSSIDVLVVPPIWEEAYGMTVDEAKVAGIPVIASQVGGIPEHLKPGKEGFLFPPGDVGELTRLIRRLAGRPDLVEKLRPRGDEVPTIYENAEEAEGAYRFVLPAVKNRMA